MFQVIYDDNSRTVLSDGDDTAYVQGNRATVLGGLGNDMIATVLRASQPREISTDLFGGKGNDTLHAAMTIDGVAGSQPEEPGHVTATLNGGSGNDEIEISAASLYADQEITASGGSGADIIDVVSSYIYDNRDDSDFDSHNTIVQVDGGSGADVINVFLAGGSSGSVKIDGGAQNDTINTFGGDTTVYGGDGDDNITSAGFSSDYVSSWAHNAVHGGAGNDFMDLNAESESSENIAYGDSGDDALNLYASGYEGLSNFADGGDGNDTLRLSLDASGGLYYSASGTNEAHGGAGADIIDAVMDLVGFEDDAPATYGFNIVYGDGGDDTLTASITIDEPSEGEFRSELSGGAGNDRLTVSGGFGNILFGNIGDDTLFGSDNDDRLIGGQGNDYLRGNGGEDTFEFQSIRAREADRIGDFVIGDDVIDVSRIDANVWRGGNQAFAFDDSGNGGTGRLWVEDNPDSFGSLVYADTGRAILTIALLDGRGVDASDYSATDFLL
jgi:Ca2+-binding RTX toxin-like protein